MEQEQDKLEKFAGFCSHGNSLSSCPICKNPGKTSRVFKKSDGSAQDPEKVSEYGQEIQLELQGAERDPEFERLLSKIDLAWLKLESRRPLTHTDIDPASLNFIPAEMIVVDRSLDSGGMYSVNYNQILINPNKIKELAGRWQVPEHLILLEFLTHEEGHAVSKTESVGVLDDVGSEYSLRTGYSVFHGNEDDESKDRDVYTMFEEGVNEKWSREIIMKYLQAHPDFADGASIEKFKSKYEDDSWAKIYGLEVSLVEAMIARLAHDTGVARETVWDAILRSKLEGQDLDQPDFQELARQFFSEKFMDRIKTADSSYHSLEAVPLIQELDLGSIDPALLSRIEVRIKAAQAWKAESQTPESLAA